MRKRILILAFTAIMLLVLANGTPAEAKRQRLLEIKSPDRHQVCLQDTVEIVVEVKSSDDHIQVWLNGRDISERFPGEGNLRTAVIDRHDGLRTYGEDIATTRDDKGVWFLEGRKQKFRAKQPPYNRLRVKVQSAKRRTAVDTCTFKVDTSLHDTFEAMGYAVATDRLWQMELYRRNARGRLAEIFGESQLQSDVMMRTLGYSDQELAKGFANLDAESQAAIAGYVAGINRRIDDIRVESAPLPFEYAALLSRGLSLGLVLPDWTVEDVLAWCALLQRNFDPEALDQAQLDNAVLLEHLVDFAAVNLKLGETQLAQMQAMQMFQDLRWPNDPEAQTYIVDMQTMAGEDGTMDGTLRRVPGLKEACDRLKERRDTINKNLKKINAKVKMGSYAWVVSGKKTASGNPIIYSGPQMGFSVPSIVCEGSIRAAGLNISGMTVPGIPGIIIGRTPHHAWSMQVGHAHTVDFYREAPQSVTLHRMETIKVRGGNDVTIPIFRSPHGPIIEPFPYNPASPPSVIVSWAYAHWGREVQTL
ncbi:MAG TPA: penicillin acylase family protein, partial [Desulfosarcina sp.]|nr:penicillin acylase family protein [Desulfosarcina sp.]